MSLRILDVTTTSGQKFSGEDSAKLAYLVFRRFGDDYEAGAEAWRRMLQNDCPTYKFEELVNLHVDSVLDSLIAG